MPPVPVPVPVHDDAVVRGRKSVVVTRVRVAGCGVPPRGPARGVAAAEGGARVEPADGGGEERDEDAGDAEDDDGEVVVVDGGVHGVQRGLDLFCCVPHAVVILACK